MPVLPQGLLDNDKDNERLIVVDVYNGKTGKGKKGKAPGALAASMAARAEKRRIEEEEEEDEAHATPPAAARVPSLRQTAKAKSDSPASTPRKPSPRSPSGSFRKPRTPRASPGDDVPIRARGSPSSPMSGTSGGDIDETQEFGDAGHLVPCDLCGRKFREDRISTHMKVRRGGQRALDVGGQNETEVFLLSRLALSSWR